METTGLSSVSLTYSEQEASLELPHRPVSEEHI